MHRNKKIELRITQNVNGPISCDVTVTCTIIQMTELMLHACEKKIREKGALGP